MWQNSARGKLENSLTNIFIPFFVTYRNVIVFRIFWEIFLIKLSKLSEQFQGQFGIILLNNFMCSFSDNFVVNFWNYNLNNFRDKFLQINLVEHVRTVSGTFPWGISETISWALSMTILGIILWAISGSISWTIFGILNGTIIWYLTLNNYATYGIEKLSVLFLLL